MTMTEQDTPQDLPAILIGWGLDPEATQSHRIAHRLESHRANAVHTLTQLIKEAQGHLDDLNKVDDPGTWLWKAQRETRTAGYSNTLSTMAAEVVAELAQIQGIVEAIA